MSALPQLWTIPISHYCDKARWALDHAGIPYVEHAHVPLMHMLPMRRAGGKSMPTLRCPEGEVLTESLQILEWADSRDSGKAPLLPEEPGLRHEVDELEEVFSGQLGPHGRRWLYGHALKSGLLRTHGATGAPAWERVAVSRPFLPVVAAVIRKAYRVNPESCARSAGKIDGVLDQIDARIEDGRRYLVGNRFSAADLSFATMMAPVVCPPEYGVPLPPVATLGPAAEAQIDRWRARPAGQLASRLYREERPPTARVRFASRWASPAPARS